MNVVSMFFKVDKKQPHMIKDIFESPNICEEKVFFRISINFNPIWPIQKKN